MQTIEAIFEQTLKTNPEARELLLRTAAKLRGIDLEKLRANGVWRDPKTYEFIVTYPPLPAMKEMREENIYPSFNGTTAEAYIHIPFCENICFFCGRFTKYSKRPEPEVSRYFEAVKKEIDMLLKKCPPNLEITSLYIGGGTPTYPTTEQLIPFLEHCFETLPLKSNIEITIEADPNQRLTEEKLVELKKLGVNRLSIGIQSFDDKILKIIGRSHTREEGINAFHLARKAGFQNINIDLMSGLPEEILPTWLDTLKTTSDLKPECITVYPTYYQETCSLYYRKDLNFPTDTEYLFMHTLAVEWLEKEGRLQQPVRYFSNNVEFEQWKNKWQKSANLLPIGVSSYGFIDNVQFHNHMDLPNYYASIEKGKLPVWKGVALDADETMSRYIIFKLKYDQKIENDVFQQKFGKSIQEEYPTQLIRLQQLGLVENNQSGFQLTYAGMIFCEEVCLQFYTTKVKKDLQKLNAVYSGYMFKPVKYQEAKT